jgi:FAD:protein FMN transferase
MAYQKITKQFPAMGTLVSLEVHARNEANALKAFVLIEKRFAALNAILSDYDPQSEVNRLCRSAYQRAVPVSRELFTVLQFAQTLALRSRGAFDVTIGARTRGRRGMVSGTVGYQYVSLGAQTVSLAHPDMQLDFGGIAKGYAADEASAIFRRAGLPSHSVAASGDIVVGAAPPGQPGWRVGLGTAENYRVLQNRSVSTSGNASQPGHIHDPRTGQSLRSQPTVVVIAPNGITADALATAFSVLPETEHPALLAQYPGVELLVLPAA